MANEHTLKGISANGQLLVRSFRNLTINLPSCSAEVSHWPPSVSWGPLKTDGWTMQPSSQWNSIIHLYQSLRNALGYERESTFACQDDFVLIKEVLMVIKSGKTHSYFVKHSPTEPLSLKNWKSRLHLFCIWQFFSFNYCLMKDLGMPVGLLSVILP